MATATKTRPARATRKAQPEPVVATTTEPDQPVQEEPAVPEQAPEAETVEAVEPTSAPPFPVWVRPAPNELRERREGLKLSRTGLAELAKISASRVWASEQPSKEVSDEHIRALVAALDHVDEHGLPEHLRPKAPFGGKGGGKGGVTKAVLESRAKTALLILEEAASKKTVKELHALVDQATAALVGTEETNEANETKGGDA